MRSFFAASISCWAPLTPATNAPRTPATRPSVRARGVPGAGQVLASTGGSPSAIGASGPDGALLLPGPVLGSAVGGFPAAGPVGPWSGGAPEPLSEPGGLRPSGALFGNNSSRNLSTAFSAGLPSR